MSAVTRPDAIAPSALRPLPYPALTPQQRVERHIDDAMQRPERLMRNTLVAVHALRQSRRFEVWLPSAFGEL